jgi:pimeloyl-ACP methyl ester carboxylesterase
LLFDEYAKQEQDDGVEVIAWLAAQPWCSGTVGMMGISWGGFNGLQIAARRPPALKAIVTICSTDDRYADDAHYMGGTLLSWTSGRRSFSAMCLPPDPMLAGDGWRAMVGALENMPLFFGGCAPAADAYWKHGSVCENSERSMPRVRRRRLTDVSECNSTPARGTEGTSRVSSGHGHTRIRTLLFPARRSVSCKRCCVGGIIG